MPFEHDIEVDLGDLDFGDPEPMQQPPLRIEVGAVPTEANDALIAALNSLSERQSATDERQAELVQIVKDLAGMVTADREYLTASLDALAAALREQPAPVVNVPAFPEIPAPVVNVQPADVHVTVAPPPTHRKLKIQRDPLTNMIASADIEEVNGG